MNAEQTTEFDTLRTKLPIHIQTLHKDAQAQPGLAERAGELVAELKADAKRARLAIEEAKAIADKAIRESPGDYGLAKATEASVQSAIALVPEVKIAQRDYIDASYNADKAVELLDAFQHRKSMIQDEVRLYLGNYWGEAEVKDMEDVKADLVEDTEKRANASRRERRRSREKRQILRSEYVAQGMG